MRVALVAALALAVCAVPGCARKASTWKEWIDEVPAEWKAERYDRAFALCTRALEHADSEKNGPRAVAALECVAEAATRLGKPEMALPAYESVLRDYDNDLRISGGALRIRNNFAVALVEAGRKQEGVDLLDASLDAYEGTPQRSLDNFRVRLQLVANLARAVRVFPDSDASVRVSTELLQEIENHLATSRFRKNYSFTLGCAEAMAAIAELIRIRGDPRHAEDLLAASRDQLAIEDEVLAGKMRRIPCEPVTIRSLVLRPCYATLR